MGYTKQSWQNNSASTPLSAERLSHMETQYDEAMAQVAADVADSGTDIGTALNATYAPKIVGSPTDGQTAVWDDDNDRWIPGDVGTGGGGGGATAVYALGDANVTRPDTDEPVVWYMLSGVTPVNAESGDMIATVTLNDPSPAGPVGTTHDWRVSMITDDDDTVLTSWPDFMGGLDMSAIGSPTVTTLSGRRGVLFNGTDQGMSAAMGVVAQPFSMLMVATYLGSTASGTTRLLIGTGEASGSYRASYLNRSVSTDPYLYAPSTSMQLGAAMDNNRHVYAAVVDGASSTIIRDGVSNTGNPGSEGLEDLNIGSTNSAAWPANIFVERVLFGTFDAAAINAWRTDPTVSAFYDL